MTIGGTVGLAEIIDDTYLVYIHFRIARMRSFSVNLPLHVHVQFCSTSVFPGLSSQASVVLD